MTLVDRLGFDSGSEPGVPPLVQPLAGELEDYTIGLSCSSARSSSHAPSAAKSSTGTPTPEMSLELLQCTQ
jgi:hypothetical protein